MKILNRSLMLSCLLGAGSLWSLAGEPGIVVGIIVDQLRTDYLEQLRPYFGNRGFNRLISDGAYFTDVDFRNTVSDAPSGAAVVYTGAWPAANGLPSEYVFNSSLMKNVPALAADQASVRLDYSPENLKLSTIADELFINGGNLTKIYSVAGNPQLAVVSAGHAGNSAIWLDETAGKWSSPSYYGSMPPAVSNRNRTAPPASKASSSSWRASRPASTYPMGSTWRDGDFNYGFSSADRNALSRFKLSPLFNVEITDVGLDLLKTMRPSGSNGQPGMLNLAYSLAPIDFDYDGDNRPELVDAYVRLDAELGRLLDAVDRDFGLGNAVIFLASTGYADEPSIPDAEARIPTGEITLKKAESLLNSYLAATYGNGDYVNAITNNQLFLNTKAIEKKGLKIKDLRNEAKSFLLRMGGIGEVLTLDEVIASDSRKAAGLALGIDVKNSPDLFLSFTPGWTVTDDNSYPPVSKKTRLASPPTPAFILGADIAPQIVTSPVEATALAPTIAGAVNIRAPNGAATKPLYLKKN